MNTKHRLVMTLAGAGVPTDRVTVNEAAHIATIDSYVTTPTQAQIDAGAAILAAFDWSAAAQQAWEDSLQPARADLRNNLQTALDAIDQYLAIADTATAAQVRDQVKRLTQMMRRVLVRLGQLSEGQ